MRVEMDHISLYIDKRLSSLLGMDGAFNSYVY